MTSNLLIGIFASIIGGLVTTALLAVLRWELKRLKGDTERLSYWFYTHLKQIVVVGVLANAFLLAWVLLRFPTVNIWSVLFIVLSVVLMGFEIGVFLLIRTIEGVIKAIANFLMKLGEKSTPKI
jgi:hypothetical protein